MNTPKRRSLYAVGVQDLRNLPNPVRSLESRSAAQAAADSSDVSWIAVQASTLLQGKAGPPDHPNLSAFHPDRQEFCHHMKTIWFSADHHTTGSKIPTGLKMRIQRRVFLCFMGKMKPFWYKQENICKGYDTTQNARTGLDSGKGCR